MQRDTLEVRTSENVGIGYEAAGLASRFLAFAMDVLLILVVIAFADILVAAVVGADAGLTLIVILGVAVPFFVINGYFIVAETSSAGRTPGKRALGLRVIRVDGGAPGLGEAMVRNLVRLVDLSGAGVLCMFFHPQARRLGDLAAGTLVVRERPAHSAPPPLSPVILRTPDAGPAIDRVERLGTTEYSALRTFLSRYGLTPDQRQRLAAEIARRLLDRLELPPGAPERQWPPELFLERLYLQLAGRLESVPR